MSERAGARVRLAALALASAALVGAFAAGRADEPGTAVAMPSGGRELCVGCHTDLEPQLGGRVVHGPVADDDCVACHDPHAARHRGLLKQAGQKLCLPCHDEVRQETHRQFLHGALRDERACLACHAPHASQQAALLREPAATLCAGCHESIAPKLAREHPHPPAALGDCGSCHQPHAADRMLLLAAAVPELCTTCHATDDALKRAHGGFALAGADCGSCHDPHGATAAGLVRESAHPPFAEGECDTCHASPARPATLTADQAELCTICHEPPEGPAGSHPAGGEVRCTDCHSPHAGEPPGMVRGAQRAVCLGCHDEIRATIDRGASRHPLKADEGRCTACHRPHGAAASPLLANEPAALCESCHETHARFAHPMGPNVPDPSRPGAHVNCLSCHQPHASGEKMLLRGSPDRELCIRCHAGLQ